MPQSIGSRPLAGLAGRRQDAARCSSSAANSTISRPARRLIHAYEAPCGLTIEGLHSTRCPSQSQVPCFRGIVFGRGMTSLPRSRSGDCYGRRNREMIKRLVQRRTALLAAAGTVALLAVVGVPVAAGNGNGHGNGNGNGNGNSKSNNRLLAAGTATERLGGGVQWHIQFQIHARNNGKSSKVSVQTPTSTFSYIGSVCSGSYTTAAGTTRLRRRSPDVVRRHRLRGSVLRLLDPQGRADGSRLLVGLVVCFSGSRPGRLREPGGLASDAVRARRCLRSVQGLTRGSRNNGHGGRRRGAPLLVIDVRTVLTPCSLRAPSQPRTPRLAGRFKPRMGLPS